MRRAMAVGPSPAGPPRVMGPMDVGPLGPAKVLGPPDGFQASSSSTAPAQPRRSRSTGPALAARRSSAKSGKSVEALKPWLDPAEIKAPRGGKRWLPDRTKMCSAAARRETRALLKKKVLANDFSGWQMPFPFELSNGESCPICTLGECGDANCPTYRPTHPEVREAIETLVVERCLEHLVDPPARFDTYVSVGCGLLAQDWIILEKLQSAAAELRPCRVVFVELRTAGTVMACEGRTFEGDRGLDLRRIGFGTLLGPEFSFSAIIAFEGPSCWGSRIFDFGNGRGQDNVFVEVAAGEAYNPEAPGTLIFGIIRDGVPQALPVHGCWVPGQAHLYLFTVSATGVMRVYVDNRLAAAAQGHPPRPMERKNLFVGQSSEDSNTLFRGSMRKIKVWDHCVDPVSVENLFADEVERALQQFTNWHAGDLTVWSFGTLAAYTAAVAEDPRFSADLLLRVDVHDEIDGYDDFVRKVLSPHGLALTLGGPGRSWRRRGAKVEELPIHCEVLEAGERRMRLPWAFLGSGRVGWPHYCREVETRQKTKRWPPNRSRRVSPQRDWTGNTGSRSRGSPASSSQRPVAR